MRWLGNIISAMVKRREKSLIAAMNIDRKDQRRKNHMSSIITRSTLATALEKRSMNVEIVPLNSFSASNSTSTTVLTITSASPTRTNPTVANAVSSEKVVKAAQEATNACNATQVTG